MDCCGDAGPTLWFVSCSRRPAKPPVSLRAGGIPRARFQACCGTRRIMEVVEMPNRVAENLVMFIRQNNGTLSQRRREGEFKKLGDEEVALIEGIVSDEFAGF